MISDDQRAGFSSSGYVLFENVLPQQEVDGLRQLLDVHVRQHQSVLKLQNSQGISRAGEISFTQHLAERDSGIAEFVRHPRLVEIAAGLLGPELDLYWDQAVYKLPETSREFPWHQDNGYTALHPEQYLTLWIALVDATIENGCLWVVPGSHTAGVRPHVETSIGRAADPGERSGVAVPAHAGDVLAFSSLLLHKSGPNLSTSERKAFIVQYAPVGAYSEADGKPVSRGAVARGGRPVLSVLQAGGPYAD